MWKLNPPTLLTDADFQTSHTDDQFLRHSQYHCQFKLILLNDTFYMDNRNYIKKIVQYVLPNINITSYIVYPYHVHLQKLFYFTAAPTHPVATLVRTCNFIL